MKPVPVTLAPEIVTLAVPEFVNTTVELPVLPTLIFPKLTVAGLAPAAHQFPCRTAQQLLRDPCRQLAQKRLRFQTCSRSSWE